ncbi:phospholipid-translocating P-type ATPase [Eremomyces bilateralis CBS 781.70]|uniref:Phospholipid-transporting ATPase n=1 Tax=Eremomyces bilateralis CBS 781.70 TaxID=1392243 RepID=A0A6G1G3K1_9PEZI|nr:phospholipid-translocating P-type ATPase [Eremomyces bilateralis CBS 781.70]KAF1812685.1 phospholipid-translocating P-type ATPase [Eremomyces bilateralis CBS 781.70]
MAQDENVQSNVSESTKRLRWATKRTGGKAGDRKRKSIMDRLHRRTASNDTKSNFKRDSNTTDGPDDLMKPEEPEPEEEGPGRRIFFNLPLPPEARDEDGHPTQHYARNKIRTSKYTPISFIPKNLWFQFHNIANIYFLFSIILGAFPIFGVVDPALNAVPLIVILTLTALKDAIEDWGRTVLDNQLNNAPVYKLAGFSNVNTAEDQISLWRRFKKANTRAVLLVWRLWTNRDQKKIGRGKTADNEPRPSIGDRRQSVMTQRTSFLSTRSGHDDIQMTPVQTPPLGAVSSAATDEKHGAGFLDVASQDPDGVKPPGIYKKVHGSVINPFKEAPENARFKQDAWKNVQVGDYVRLFSNQEIPADVVILSTSEKDGACYVETKNLDGETNLKVRQSLHCGRQIKHARDCEKAEFVIESEPPHANLYVYNAVARWNQRDPKNEQAPGVEMAEPITANNLLLRGCILRNTEWALGVVIFTGQETKIMLNSGITPSKRAKLSKDLNWYVLYNFVILFCMCLIAGIYSSVSWAQGRTSANHFEYGNYGGTATLNGLITFCAGIILFQNLVPISLYITLEIVRTLQAFFIYSDVLMYYEPIDYPCTPKTWNISDDVGQIEYIFSDKTGTLTQNVMEFKKCTINGEAYGEAYTEAMAGMQRRQRMNVEEESAKALKQIAEDRVRMLEDIRSMHPNPYLQDSDLTFVAPDFIEDLRGDRGEAQEAANKKFMIALALCHTVMVDRMPGDPPTIDFKAQSPDEAALVATAKDVGFTMLARTDDGVILNVLGEEQKYTVMNVLEFNSTRKRMSAIIRMPDDRIVLFCKGADSMIYSRLQRGEQAELRKTTAEHLEMFAREGLRTLCIAQRELSESEYGEWNRDYELAAASIADREDKLEGVSDRIERDLTLIGGTAIEDRLQEGVPDAIALLAKAGIKLWVLTGDKVETAINIGFSCNLLDNDMDLIVFRVDDEDMDKARELLDQNLSTFGLTGSDEDLKAAQDDHEPPPPTHAIVIDGDSLKLVLDESLRQKFLLLCKQCRAVLCCRVSPAQKAEVVGMVKHGLDCLTLSIGDGANDVAMIQEAHVGVGITGLEGRQAAMSSDYAIGQFRFLTRLVLVHGRWSYRRTAETILNFFYKNMIWTFTLFWYQIWAAFDTPNVFDYTYIILFNLAFTSLPVIFLGVLDQDVNDKVSLAVPQLYRRGILRKEWTWWKFWSYMFDGIIQSVLIYFSAYLTFANTPFVTDNGLDLADTKRLGVFIATVAVLVANLYVALNTYRWDWLFILIVVISTVLIFFWTGVFTSGTFSGFFYMGAAQVYGALSFWAQTLLAGVMCLIPRFTVKYIQKIYFPRDVDIVREKIRLGEFEYLKEDDSLIPAEAADKIPSLSSSEGEGKAAKQPKPSMPEEERPIYPPSVAPTATTTNNPHSQSGSDGTDFTGHSHSRHPSSFERIPALPGHITSGARLSPRSSIEPQRRSFDRARQSMDRVRPSFEASRDFTSAALLARMESSQSAEESAVTPTTSHRMRDISETMK